MAALPAGAPSTNQLSRQPSGSPSASEKPSGSQANGVFRPPEPGESVTAVPEGTVFSTTKPRTAGRPAASSSLGVTSTVQLSPRRTTPGGTSAAAQGITSAPRRHTHSSRTASPSASPEVASARSPVAELHGPLPTESATVGGALRTVTVWVAGGPARSRSSTGTTTTVHDSPFRVSAAGTVSELSSGSGTPSFSQRHWYRTSIPSGSTEGSDSTARSSSEVVGIPGVMTTAGAPGAPFSRATTRLRSPHPASSHSPAAAAHIPGIPQRRSMARHPRRHRWHLSAVGSRRPVGTPALSAVARLRACASRGSCRPTGWSGPSRTSDAATSSRCLPPPVSAPRQL